MLLYIELIAVTAVSDGSMMSAVRYSAPVIAVCAYYEVSDSEGRYKIIKALFWIHYIFAIINFATVVFFPSGLYTYKDELYFFIGHNNAAGRFLLPTIAYAVIVDIKEKGHLGWRTYISGILAFITVCLTWSNTSMVGIGVVLVLLFVFSKRNLPTFFNMRNVFILSLVITLVLVLGNSFGIFEAIIVNVFHKDMTFTGRTTIWNAVLINIVNKPIFGYGYDVDIWSYASMGNLEPSSAHNYYLDLLFRGGIVQLLIQLVIVAVDIKRMDRQKNRLSNALTIVFIGYFIMWSFEPFVNTGYLDMLLLMLISSGLNSIYKIDSYEYLPKLHEY
ncbi:MAG: O-antigen ligase family protein [Oscillospiraceae bacterium]|nr:O-antigen ligase family protein [Oscillospiraceae bacterium]